MSAPIRDYLVRMVGDEDMEPVSLGDVARLMRRTATLLENTTDFDATVPKFRVYNVADTIDRMIEETGQ